MKQFRPLKFPVSLLFVALSLVLAVSCTNTPVAGANKPDAPANPPQGGAASLDAWLDPDFLAGELSSKPPVSPQDAGPAHWTLVDVRTPDEFSAGHIPGAVNIPLDRVEQAAAGWNKDALYVLYCRSGNRSGQAQRLLAGMGFGRTVNFGGISRWNGTILTGE